MATTDLLIEGRHFRRDWSPPYDIGRKAAAQNLSDVAAMGARATALLIGLGAPPSTTVEWVESLYDGLRDECALVGASVAGGDVVKTDELVIAVTALGDLEGRRPVTRSGAGPGDVVALNGRLGYAAGGVEALSRGDTEPADLIAAHRRPEPPYDAGPQAALLGATAMLDVSDGLVQDLGHVAAASGVRIELFSEAIPLPPTAPQDAPAPRAHRGRGPRPGGDVPADDGADGGVAADRASDRGGGNRGGRNAVLPWRMGSFSLIWR